ncbi:MAG: GWxTD domain-containing protein [Acidobacteria bacterium]|jgi:GWxTD domain-containing protein|nr:GWxTD domain-containing protein [Acidobacteriota bacterium]
MSKKILFRNLTLAAGILAASVSAGFAQKKNKEQPSQDVSDKSRNVKVEVKKVYKDWVNKDVAYIITGDEKKAFGKLANDEERENFIENFWRRRDPNPDTEENEYREQYYERIAYANEHYASGIPGWKTDRGRIYITFGKPDSVESHPSGGSYDRPSYEGGGSTTTYPFETWFYRHLDNVGEGIEIEFVDPTGTGEYRIARSPNEKDALANVPGAGLTTAEQLGLSNKGDRLNGIGNNNYQREQDNPFRRMEIISNLSRPPQVKFTDLEQLAGGDSGVVDNNPLDFDMQVDFFRQSESSVVTTFTIQASNKELVFDPSGGLPTAKMNIFGRITAVSGRRSGIFEDSATTTASESDLNEARDRKSVYQKAYTLPPGTYKVDVVVRDVVSGSKGVRSIGFTVPKYEENKLNTSSLILASKLYSTTERDIGAMFVIGDTKVVPNLSGVYKKGQDVGIYMQVYNAGIDQTTLRPAVDVEYVLSKDGKELAKTKEDWKGLSDAGQRLTLARLLPTAQLTAGSYEIKVKVKDLIPNSAGKIQTLEQTGKFSVQ